MSMIYFCTIVKKSRLKFVVHTIMYIFGISKPFYLNQVAVRSRTIFKKYPHCLRIC